VEGRGINQYKGECSGSIAHFVSNVDLFFILFNNKLSTICPKLVCLGVLSWGGGGGEVVDYARKHGSVNKNGKGREGRGRRRRWRRRGREEGGGRREKGVGGEQRAYANVTTKTRSL